MPTCVTRDGADFTLGTGETAFEAVSDEQDLSMISGPQGGCHFWLAGKTDGFAERRFSVRYDVVYADSGDSTGSTSSNRLRLEQDPAAPGQCQFFGFTAFLIEPWKFEDQRVRIDVMVTDDEGRTAMQSKTVVARWPDDIDGTPREELCGPGRP